MDYFIYNFQKFLLVFSRIMGLILTAPFFASASVTNRVKLSLAFILTGVVFPLVYQFLPMIPNNIILFSMLAIGQGLIGAAIGIFLRIYFSVFQLAGQFFTVQMGFGASEVFDPMSQISLPLMGQYLYLAAILVFVTVNGPMFIIKDIFVSFKMINFSNIQNGKLLFSENGIITIFTKLFIVSLRISLPIIGTLLLVSISMGLLAKAAPQMNLLMIGFPISITVAFIIIIMILPSFVNYVSNYFFNVFDSMWKLFLDIKHG